MPRLALLALAALASGCAGRAAASAPPGPIPVALATAIPVADRALYTGPAAFASTHTYRVGAELTARVVRVAADVGDRVSAGSTLAVLASDDLAAQDAAARARADAASAAALKTRRGPRPAERAAADDAVAAAAAALARALAAQRLADANVRRYDALYASGDVAAVTRDSAATTARDAAGAVTAARAQLAAAHAQRALVDEGPRREERDAAEADARAANANAALAGVQLAKTRIVAPADAIVQSRELEPGAIAVAGTPAFTLVDAAPPELRAAVPETRLGGIAPGTPARVALAGRGYAARVTRVEPAVDPATRTATVRLAVDGIRATDGAVAEVTIGRRLGGGDARVPLGAIVTDTAGHDLLVVVDAARRARRQPVRVVADDGLTAAVVGIRPGTTVVRAGGTLVPSGATVREATP